MIDLYCERVAPGLWGEPLNVLSNVGYLIAGWLLLDSIRRRSARDHQALALAALPVFIAAGSVFFHVFAAPWARRLDEVPILMFQLLLVWLYSRRALLWPSWAAAVAVFLLAVAVGIGRLGHGLNGSMAYLPPLAVAVGITFHHRYRSGRLDLLVPLLLFFLAIAFRAIDSAACAAIPTGTHFIWHLLTAFVVYAFARDAIRKP